MAIDFEGQFRESCERYSDYPFNLLGCRYFGSQLEQLALPIGSMDERLRLFDANEPFIDFIEVYDGEDSEYT